MSPLDGTNGSREKSGKSLSLKDALDRIEKVLDDMNMDRPFMKSAILSISIGLLNSDLKTVEEIIWELEGIGVDAFMEKHKVEGANAKAKTTTGKRSAMAMGAVKAPQRRPPSVQMAAVNPTSGSGELPSVTDNEPAVGAKFKAAREAASQASTAASEASANIAQIFQEARGEITTEIEVDLGGDDKSEK